MRRDIIYSLIVGFVTALFAILIFKNLNNPFLNRYLFLFFIIIPFLWFIGIILGQFLGTKINVIFFQGIKFIEVGFMNTAVDFGVLNLAIYLAGISSGIYYSIFKMISFLVAVTNSYFWNKFWTFGVKKEKWQSNVRGGEFLQFLIVTSIGLIINVSIASFIVNFITPITGLNKIIWANIGAVVATVISLLWNFLGYKFIVFKENNI